MGDSFPVFQENHSQGRRQISKCTVVVYHLESRMSQNLESEFSCGFWCINLLFCRFTLTSGKVSLPYPAGNTYHDEAVIGAGTHFIPKSIHTWHLWALDMTQSIFSSPINCFGTFGNLEKKGVISQPILPLCTLKVFLKILNRTNVVGEWDEPLLSTPASYKGVIIYFEPQLLCFWSRSLLMCLGRHQNMMQAPGLLTPT